MLMLASVVAVQLLAVAAAWLLRMQEERLHKQLPYLVSMAVGVLVAMAFLHLLPEAVEELGNGRAVWLTVAATLFGLFALERLFLALSGMAASELAHPHLHSADCADTHRSVSQARPLNLMAGSGLHSLADGAAIATAFAASPRLGLLTALAVALHEVPHRMGDVAVLLHLDVGASRAMRYAALVGAPAVAGALVVLLLGATGALTLRWLLPISAGSFLYIAGVDLLPELGPARRLRPLLAQLACLAAGVALVLLVAGLAGAG